MCCVSSNIEVPFSVRYKLFRWYGKINIRSNDDDVLCVVSIVCSDENIVEWNL